MAADVLENLNPLQREAVLHFQSPLLIVAGAGSGKTRVITHKIAYAIRQLGVEPRNILGVTFTNKAANEMRTRIEALTGIEAHRFNISTFHSLGLRLLRESGQAVGFDREWKVTDEEDHRRIIDALIREHFPYFTNDQRDGVVRKINMAKMNMAYPNNPDFLRQKGLGDEEIRIFSLYHDYQQKNKIWDFEDLISLSARMLESVDSVRIACEKRFRYILIDEFQDTNPNQYELIKLISGGAANITVVGDDDQAIYSWRGASIRFLFDFERDFPGARIIKLEQNYRSTRQILEFANNLISHNLQRRGKQMWSESENGSRVYVLKSRSKEEEAERIGNFILRLRERNPELFPLALLYRINSQSLPLETEFLKKGISFQILRGQRFFERKEIKDSLSLLRLALDPGDDLAFLRLIDFLPLGIGAKTSQMLGVEARERGVPLFQALREFMPDKYAAREIFGILADLNERKGELTVSRILLTLLSRSGYMEILEEKGENERVMNINELVDFIQKWESENPKENFSDLVDRMTLDSRDKKAEGKTMVFLLTMHNAKGLEFPSVIATGVNSTYMPFFLRKDPLAIEEERRLFYVASTRAIKLLVISTGSERPSPFIREVAPSLYVTANAPEEIVEDLQPAVPAAKIAHGAQGDHGGRFISHPFFGKGKIVEAIGDNKYLVNFTERGNKLIDASVVHVEFL